MWLLLWVQGFALWLLLLVWCSKWLLGCCCVDSLLFYVVLKELLWLLKCYGGCYAVAMVFWCLWKQITRLFSAKQNIWVNIHICDANSAGWITVRHYIKCEPDLKKRHTRSKLHAALGPLGWYAWFWSLLKGDTLRFVNSQNHRNSYWYWVIALWTHWKK